MFNYVNTPKLNRTLFIALIGISLLVYMLTLAPSVLLADAGEFQFVPWLPGIAHPTGYPLYVLLGWLFSHLIPFGEVAWRLNLFSAVASAGTIGIVYLISQELTTKIAVALLPIVHRLVAFSAALIFAFTYTFWSQAIIAEVYGLHAFFVAIVLGTTLRLNASVNQTNSPRLTFEAGWLLALTFGLSLTHHRTMVVMIPAILLTLWLQGWRKISFSDATKLITLLALPGLLYLYLPLIAPFVPYTRLQLNTDHTLVLYDQTPTGFINHVLGRVFTGEVRPAAVTLDRFSIAFDFLRQQVGWFGGFLALVGLGSLIRHRVALALTLGSFLSFLAFNLVYFVGDIEVFFIPCWLILCLWIGLGWLAIIRPLAERIIQNKRARIADNPVFKNTAVTLDANMSRLLTIILAAVLILFPSALLFTRYSEIDQSQNILARDAWLEILGAELPDDAILISNDRNEIMPMWYFQYVENRREDLLGLFPLITTAAEVANIGRLLDLAFQANRPVYLVKPMPGLEVKADFELLAPLPHAQLVKVVPAKTTPDHALDLVVSDNLTLAGYDQTKTDASIIVTLYWQPHNESLKFDYTSYVHVVDSGGSNKAQSEDHPPGGVFYPTSLWHPGEILRDIHMIRIPNTLSPGEYTLVTGLYRRLGNGQLESLGEALKVGTIIVAE